jgi:hypothetical protein
MYDQPMHKPDLPPIFPNRPLNLNEDGTNIKFRKFHMGIYSEHWLQADAMKFLPKKVIDFYKLRPYIHKNALYCAVLKTHYGLPEAGALSQERLFAHLLQHGYTLLPHSQVLFRNKNGSIRFSLVMDMDDFAVIWSKKESMDHLIKTLRKLYTVKVNWEGAKYLGMNITIDRPKRCVTLSMPGYVDKLLHKSRPLELTRHNTSYLHGTELQVVPSPDRYCGYIPSSYT